MHYGTKRHSGRYPYGSGDNPYQHESEFLNTFKALKSQGLTEKEIAAHFDISTKELREKKAYERAELKAAELAYIIKLKDSGYSNIAIGEKIGKTEGYVRYALNPVVKERNKVTTNVADAIKDRVKTVKYLDIGPGTNLYIPGVSKEKLNAAVRKLRDEEGYTVNYIKVEQAGNPGNYTTLKVLAAPGVTYKDIYENRDQIGLLTDIYSNDGGKTVLGVKPPTSVDSSRIKFRYSDEGGSAKDGVIELRPGVEDISLGGANYAQVRIAVDGTHYMKGMAVYSYDMPPGVDIIFNSNKTKDTPILGPKGNSILKPLKKDPDNPFGSTLRMEDGQIVGQRNYIDENGETKLSPINIIRQEGDWNKWSNTLSSQFLSKQPKELIKQQLNKSYADKESEFKDIQKITQPEVKRKLMLEFADDCDASASHLKAAALPRQSSKVILPLNDISDTEVYAPTYRNGEQVALVRHPHAGTFEIPVLTVNNNIPSARKILGQAIDGIGINSNVAAKLSGADYDGDSVLVLPMAGQNIKSSPTLPGLKNFDPKESYPKVEGMKIMGKKLKQTEMGKASNLITDMTLKGATPSELERAVKHSMVVIDAEKHELNYIQSFTDNGIEELKTKYQGGPRNGASTLISRANSDLRVPVREESIDPKTGKKIFNYDVKDKTYFKPKKDKKTGEIIGYSEVQRTTMSTKMNETDDARTLSSGTLKEEIYANYANSLKKMANDARKEAMAIKPSKVNQSAKELYSAEISSLNAKLNLAYKNKPLERKAQAIADVTVKAKKRSNPELKDDLEELKKGKKIQREGWNGKNQYLELATNISYVNPNGDVVNEGHRTMGNKAIVFVGTFGTQVGWLASQSDMLSDDWKIVK